MEGKKKYIIAAILIIFLGLTIFTFANPGDKEENLETPGNVIEQPNGGNNSKPEDNNNGSNNTNNNTNNGITNNNTGNGGNNNPTIPVVVDNSYELALEAVIKAEEGLESSLYETALGLVEEVTNEEGKNSLTERLVVVKNNIDVKALVKTLEEKVNLAVNTINKNELASAREYNTTEEIDNKVSELQNETLKEELIQVLNSLKPILNDIKEPTINIEDGAILTKVTNVSVEDDNEVKITLTREPETIANEIPNNYSLTETGVYTLTVTDKALNEKTIRFTVDLVELTYTLSLSNDDDTVWTKDSVTATIKADKDIKALDGWTKVDERTYTKVYQANVNEMVTIEDYSNNKVEVPVVITKIDTTIPIITLKKYTKDNKGVVVEPGHYNYSLTAFVEEENIDTIKLNGEDYTLGTEIGARKSYTLVVTDKAGNSATIEFTIDKDSPNVEIDGKKYKENKNNILYYNKSVTPVVSDSNLDSITLNGEAFVSGTEVSAEGEYQLIAKDKAGNKTTINFVIDKTAPAVVKVQLFNKNNQNSEYIKNGETVRVLATFNEKLNGVPSLTIGTQTVQFTKIDDGKGNDLYSADIKIAEDESALAEGTLAFSITGYKDLAGNIGEEVTTAKRSLTYDRTAPERTGLTIKSNGKTAGNGANLVWYAKVGNNIQVYAFFKEELAVLPTVRLNGKDSTKQQMSLARKNEDGTVQYGALVTVSEDDELVDGLVQVEIFNYADAAGNVGRTLTNTDFTVNSQSKVIVDKTAPAITLKQYRKDGKGAVVEPGVHAYSLTAFVEEENIDTVKLNDEDYTLGTEIGARKSYTLVVTDKAGNSAIIEFAIDKDAPNVEIDGKKYKENVKNTLYYNKSVTPVVSDSNLDSITLNDEAFVSGTEVNAEGEYQLIAKDKAGNKTTINFIIDKTVPAVVKVQLFNKNNQNSEYIKNGETVRVLATFNEKLDGVPSITIGTQTVQFTKTDDGKGNDLYSADIKIAEDESALAEGTLAFSITGYKDLAGNIGEEVTTAKRNLTYDRTAPERTGLTIKSNGKTSGTGANTVYYAKTGNRLEIYVNFAEDLAVLPTVKLNGVESSATLMDHILRKEGYNIYYALIPVTEAIADGLVNIEISGYSDAAGNVGRVLTNADFTLTSQSKVFVDNTAPTVVGVNGGSVYFEKINFKILDNSDNYKIYYGNKTTSCAALKENNWGIFTPNAQQVEEFKNGSTYQISNNADMAICVVDNNDNFLFINNIIVKEDSSSDGVISAINNGENTRVVLPPNTILDASKLNIPSNITILGNASSKIMGSLTLNNSKVNLYNVNLESSGAVLTVAENVQGINIHGGVYNTTDVNLQGQGAIRALGNNTISINGLKLFGGIHLLNYNESNFNIKNNTITLGYKGLTPLTGILVTTNADRTYDANSLYTSNKFNILEQPNSYYTLIQDTNWTTIDSVMITN